MDDIHLVPYDPGWPTRYAHEARLVQEALSPLPIDGIEHFGSTAIPGIAAKPIIDILIAVPSVAAARDSFPARLRPLGYVFWADNPKTDRLFFVKGMPPFGDGRTHHIHVTEPSGELWRRLAFRDYLRAHPEEAANYERLKRKLAGQHPTDREAYTDAKADYVAEVLRKAEAAR